MKLNQFTYLILIAMLFVAGCTIETEKEGIHSIEKLRTLFADPPSEFRSAPLWDWNEQISEDGIDFQMREFKEAGIGGVFVHPRPGLLTEYLSKDWFHLFDYTVQKGKELDMKVWIYDENSYPSGFAGGHVPAQMPDSYKHGSSLRMYVQDNVDVMASEDIAVVLKKNGDEFLDITASIDSEKGNTGTYYIFEKAYPGNSPWYGGFSYVDLLYPGVTDKFMELTMTKGYEQNKADFGETLPGIFTDEPNLEAAMPRGSVLRWTPDLFDVFKERWGYDLKVNLPALVEETGNWQKVRHDYYELLLELFLERWAKPWSKYCDENNLNWTGHYWEHGWPEPTDGFDESSFYIYHQMPGIDMLGNRLDTLGLGGQFGNDRAVRELRSAANQAGRIRTLSETYGGGGWEMNFEEQKRLVDWECVLGVNFVNQHLSYYSLNGVRKFDYPPSFSYHEPWWDHYKLMGDYIGRVSMAMSAGEQINSTLVLQPSTTAWMYFSRKVKNPAIQEIRSGFKNFVYQLEQQHFEYDLGSENVLKTLGSVTGNKLTVGQRDYSLVVIPAEMQNMDSPTLELLTKYLKNGGKVLSFNLTINRLDGLVSDKVQELAKAYAEQWTDVNNLKNPTALKLLKSEACEISDVTKNGMLYHQRRIFDDGQLLFVVNSHKTKKAEAEVSLPGKYLVKLDLITGEEFIYPTKQQGRDQVKFEVKLDPSGSALFITTNKNPGELQEYLVPRNEKVVAAASSVKVQRESDNILMVNYLDLKTSQSSKKETYFMDALIGLFQENGIEMGNPWQHKIQYKKNYLELDSLFNEESAFEASYHFQVNKNLSDESLNSIRAVVERPDLWQVSINGHEVTQKSNAFWIDREFPQFEIGEYLHPGKNTLTLKAPRMHILAEVMPVYMLGDFLVTPAEKGFEISGGDISVMGSWQKLGLPFYSQKVSYSQKFKVNTNGNNHYKIRLASWNGSVSEVLVNGKAAGLIAWHPNELDVTELLKEGENEISVNVIGSLKNTFGFFYHNNDSWIHGPHSWNSAPEKIPAAANYFLMDYGLFEPFELVAFEKN
ncbi:glycosyl hydrolase [Prolixibacteraceae bacterium Z1-6]|uniref:Glycosyl hydrolase n=1 Tax=Draconibacterium aestuarii TaxID=2998507 RepID=A0A9X3F527_9BACT|nr:glycosyl hydrolase [Prolixibacteraceae bacterium Z1-6]